MAVIDENHPALSGNSADYWRDSLKNKRILADELDRAIYKLTRNEVQSYTIDTGQDHYTVSRRDVSMLIPQLKNLRQEIEYLEEKTGETIIVKSHQAAPEW
jgi:hypothetical protein